MARRALTPACLKVVQAIRPWLGKTPVRIAFSGGGDSSSMMLATAHECQRAAGLTPRPAKETTVRPAPPPPGNRWDRLSVAESFVDIEELSEIPSGLLGLGNPSCYDDFAPDIHRTELFEMETEMMAQNAAEVFESYMAEGDPRSPKRLQVVDDQDEDDEDVEKPWYHLPPVGPNDLGWIAMSVLESLEIDDPGAFEEIMRLREQAAKYTPPLRVVDGETKPARIIDVIDKRDEPMYDAYFYKAANPYNVALRKAQGRPAITDYENEHCLTTDVNVSNALGMPVEVVVIDHGLQRHSAVIAETAAAQARKAGLDARVIRVEVDAKNGGVEGAAREARYKALTEGMAPGSRLLVAHTLDDQAETVLLGMLRGSGVRAMSGMRQVRKHGDIEVVRPFLNLRRHELQQACDDWNAGFYDDPSNDEVSFKRGVLRAQLVPTVGDLMDFDVVVGLAKTATLAARDADELDAQAATFWDPTEEFLSIASIPPSPALSNRVVKQWLDARGVREVGFKHIERIVEDAQRPSASNLELHLPRGLSVVRDGDVYRVIRREED